DGRRDLPAEQLGGVVQRVVDLADVARLDAAARGAVGDLRQQAEVAVVAVGDRVDEHRPLLPTVDQAVDGPRLAVGRRVVGVAVAVQGDGGQLVVLDQAAGQLQRLRDAGGAGGADLLDLLDVLRVPLHDLGDGGALEVDLQVAL